MSHTIIRVWGNFYILIHKPKVFRQLFKSVSLTFTINSGCQAWDTKKLRIILRLIDLPIPSIKLLSQKKTRVSYSWQKPTLKFSLPNQNPASISSDFLFLSKLQHLFFHWLPWNHWGFLRFHLILGILGGFKITPLLQFIQPVPAKFIPPTLKH